MQYFHNYQINPESCGWTRWSLRIPSNPTLIQGKKSGLSTADCKSIAHSNGNVFYFSPFWKRSLVNGWTWMPPRPSFPKRHHLARVSYLCRPALSTAPCSGRPPRSTAPWSSLCPRWAGSPVPSSCCRSPCSSRCAAWLRLRRCCSGWKAAAHLR